MLNLTLLLFFIFPCKAQTDSFEAGLKAYEQKNWQVASDTFAKLLEKNPNDPAVLFNLGLSEYQRNHRGAAAGYWRKALKISPGLTSARQALARLDEKFHLVRLEKSAMSLFAHDWLSFFSWDYWLAVLSLSLAWGGYRWLNYFSLRKSARLSENLETPLPAVFDYVSVFLLVFGLICVVGKFLDEQKARATLISSVELKSAPTKDGATLGTLSEGTEIEVLREHESWLQILGGEGSVGWLNQSDVIR